LDLNSFIRKHIDFTEISPDRIIEIRANGFKNSQQMKITNISKYAEEELIN
jgi:hypothetical protein